MKNIDSIYARSDVWEPEQGLEVWIDELKAQEQHRRILRRNTGITLIFLGLILLSWFYGKA